MKKFFKRTLIFVSGIYLSICCILYFIQEKIIFHPQKLDSNHQFQFDNKFEELTIEADDGVNLNGLLFKADSCKGLIFYLHGNAGSLASWGWIANTYTQLGYDVFMLDYRGFGKSEGEIQSEGQLYSDIQNAYNQLTTRYPEQNTSILGYSIGTGIAAKIACDNNPKKLILQAPYYSLTDMMKQNFSLIPTFILKYKFDTYLHLKECKMPIIIFHGNKDEVIYYESSVKLQEHFKPEDRLITLEGQGHTGISDNSAYQEKIKEILSIH